MLTNLSLHKGLTLLGLSLTMLTILGCPPSVVPDTADELNCLRPPGVMALNPVDFHLLKTNLGNFTLGGIDLVTKPQVFEVLKSTARDALAHEYIICRSQKQGFIVNGPQANHVRSKLQFMSTQPPPTAAQYADWEKEHPYPSN